MTASNLLVQIPPDAFDPIGVGRIGREKVQDDAMAPLLEIFLHGVALMTAGLITDDVKRAVAEQAAA